MPPRNLSSAVEPPEVDLPDGNDGDLGISIENGQTGGSQAYQGGGHETGQEQFQPAAPEPEGPPTSILQWARDTFQNLGIGEDVQHDGQLIHWFASRAQQAAQLERQREEESLYTRLGQQVAPNIDQYRQFQQGQAQPQPQAPNPWEAPEFNPEWMQFLEFNEQTGRYIPRANTPSFAGELAQKTNQFSAWQQSYARNPAAVLKPMVEHVFKEMFGGEFESRVGVLRQHTEVQRIRGEIQTWAYERDAGGRLTKNLTPAGAAYRDALQEAIDYGITDFAKQHSFAMKAANRLIPQPGQQPPVPQQQSPPSPTQGIPLNQAQRLATRSNQANVNPLQTQTMRNRAANVAATAPETPLSLGQMLGLAFSENGIDDNSFRDV